MQRVTHPRLLIHLTNNPLTHLYQLRPQYTFSSSPETVPPLVVVLSRVDDDDDDVTCWR